MSVWYDNFIMKLCIGYLYMLMKILLNNNKYISQSLSQATTLTYYRLVRIDSITNCNV